MDHKTLSIKIKNTALLFRDAHMRCKRLEVTRSKKMRVKIICQLKLGKSINSKMELFTRVNGKER